MHISEQVVILVIQGIVTLILSLLAFSFRTQVSLLKANIATQDASQSARLEAVRNDFTSRIDNAAMERQNMLSELKDYLVSKMEEKTSKIASGFVPIRLCELMHEQSIEKSRDLVTRIEHIEARIDDIDRKISLLVQGQPRYRENS